MIDVCVTGEIEASAQKVFAIAAGFGNVEWMQGITRCEVEGDGPGMVRSIYAGDGPPVKEELEFIDEAQLKVGYTISENLPLPVTDYHSVMSVVDSGSGRCRLEWSCQAKPKDMSDEQAKAVVEGMYGVLISWVKAYAEK